MFMDLLKNKNPIKPFNWPANLDSSLNISEKNDELLFEKFEGFWRSEGGSLYRIDGKEFMLPVTLKP